MPSYPYTATLSNPGAETNSATPWAAISPKTAGPGVSSYGADVPAHTGSFYFVGADAAANTWWGQAFTLNSAYYDAIDSGHLKLDASAWHTGFSGDSDSGALCIECFNSSMDWLAGRFAIQTDPSTWGVDSLSMRVPSGTRTIRMSTRNVRFSGTQLSTYWDDFALSLSVASNASALLYHLYNADTAGWVQALGTLASAVETGFAIESCFYWTATATGDAYYPVLISDSAQIAAIDNASCSVDYHVRQSNFDGSFDPGRPYLEFYDASSTIIGSRYYGIAANTIGPVYGMDATFTAPVPTGTRAIRTGIYANRTGGSNLDSYFSAFAVFLTGLSLVSSTGGGGGGSSNADVYRGFPLQGIRLEPTAIGKRVFPIT